MKRLLFLLLCVFTCLATPMAMFAASHTHSYTTKTASVIMIDPTCTEEGSRVNTMACSCGATDLVTVKISPLGHNWKENGYEPAHPHHYKMRCTRAGCGKEYTESATYSGKVSGCSTCNPPHTHSYTTKTASVIMIDPTCTEAGKRVNTMACSCGATDLVTVKISPLGHNWKENGYESAHPHHYKMRCTRAGCGKEYTESATYSGKVAGCEDCYPAPVVKLGKPEDQARVILGSPVCIEATAENCHHCAVSVRYNNSEEKWLGEFTPTSGNKISLKFTPSETGTCVVTVYGRNTQTKDDPGSLGDSDAVTIKVVHTHSYTAQTASVIMIDPTCTEEGKRVNTMTCSCGATELVTVAIPPLGHKWEGDGSYESAHPHHYTMRCTRPGCSATYAEVATHTEKVIGCGICFPKPSITMTSPADLGVSTVGASVSITARTSDCHHCAISVRYNGGTEKWLGEITPAADGSISLAFSPAEAGTCLITVYGRNTKNREDTGSVGTSASVTLSVLPKALTPALVAGTVTDTSIAVNVTFPWPGTRGNMLSLRDPITGEWSDFNGQPCESAPYRTNGIYTQTGLRPDTRYRVALHWWNPTRNAYESGPSITVRTNPDPRETAYSSGKGEKFLIIVANDLYQSPYWRELADALDVYQKDLRDEGWASKIVRVNSVDDDSTRMVCSTPEELKDLIRSHYEQNYTGFVMVGSAPALPIAWKPHDDEKPYLGEREDPCDVYFADMDGEWTQITVNNRTLHVQPDDWTTSPPEMFFGRIYIKGAVLRQKDGSFDEIDTCGKEAREIIRYLEKLHRYRKGGTPSLTAKEDGRCFFYGRCDFDTAYKESMSEYTRQFSSIMVNIEKSMSNEEDFLDAISNEGSQVLVVDSHGWPGGFSYNDYLKYGEVFNDAFITSDKLRTVNAKTRAAVLLPCSTARYCSLSPTGEIIQEDCAGKSLLYNSEYMLNVFAALSEANIYTPDDSMNLLNDSLDACIGKAARNYFTEKFPAYLQTATVYGDPTVRLRKQKQVSSLPPVLLNYIDNLEVQAGATLTLPLRIRDFDSKRVSVEVSGFPTGGNQCRSVTLTNGLGNTSVQWTSDWMHCLNYYDLSVRITDDQSNSYEESFRLYVSAIRNGMLHKKAAGWTVEGNGYQLNDIPIPPFSDFEKGTEIVVNNGYAKLSQDIVLEPYRTYRMIFYAVKDNEANPAVVSIDGVSSFIDNHNYPTGEAKNLNIGPNTFEFTTGRNATYPLDIIIGSAERKVSGRFILTDFRIVPLHWEDFDERGEFSQYAYADDACKFNVGTAGELCVEQPQTEAKLALSDREYGNFSCEYDVVLLDGADNSDAGLFFRASELGGKDKNFRGYYFGMDPTSNLIRLRKADPDTGLSCVRMRIMRVETGRSYHVRVEAFDSTISVYIDDMSTPVLTYVDKSPERESFLKGMIGFRSFRCKANFDNLVIDSIREEFRF